MEYDFTGKDNSNRSPCPETGPAGDDRLLPFPTCGSMQIPSLEDGATHTERDDPNSLWKHTPSTMGKVLYQGCLGPVKMAIKLNYHTYHLESL